MNRDDVVTCARSWVGTPYKHQGRVKGVGVDCLGVIVGVAHELGLSSYDRADYTAKPDPSLLLNELRTHLDTIAYKHIERGDIVLFRIERDPQHIGIIVSTSPLRMVHSFSKRDIMRCVEHDLGEFWTRKIIGCYRFKGIS